MRQRVLSRIVEWWAEIFIMSSLSVRCHFLQGSFEAEGELEKSTI
jgi:hypothetical protein